MARRHVLKSGLLLWAKILSRTLGIDIVFSGFQPRTNGKTIYAFALPDTIDTFTERALIGAIDHECGHVDPIDGSKINTKKARECNKSLLEDFGGLGPMTWNVLEDMRIETCLHAKFPGCYDYLEAVRRWLWYKSDGFKEDREKPMDNSARSALIGLCYVRFPKLFKEIILPRVSTEILMLIRYWTPFVGRACNADDVWETYHLTVELLKDLKQMAQTGGGSSGDGIDSGIPGDSSGESAGGDSPGKGSESGDSPGESGDQQGGGSGAAGDQQGGGSGSEPRGLGGDSPASGGGPGGSDTVPDADDQFQGGNLGGRGAPETSDTPVDGVAEFDWSEVYKDNPDFADTNPESTPMSNREINRKLKDVAGRVIAEGIDDEFHVPDFGTGAIEDIGEGIEEDLEERSGYRIDSNDVFVERATETVMLAHQIEAEAQNLYPVLKQRLRTLLLAKRANRHRTDCEDGELDPGNLYSLAIPNGSRNVFSQLTRGKTVATSSLLLIDGSSSMNGNKSQVVMRCARFFADCFERCAVPTEVAVFQNTHRSRDSHGAFDYKVVKEFGENVRMSRNRFSPMASGGTPMAEAMVEAVRRLSVRREPRKLLFILTDGDPNGTYGDARAFMVRLADAAYDLYRIETTGLGVDGARTLGLCFRDFVMLDSGSRRDVEKNFIETLQSRILRT